VIEMKMYRNDDHDYVIACDEKDALVVWCEGMGEDVKDYEGIESWRFREVPSHYLIMGRMSSTWVNDLGRGFWFGGQ